VGHRRCIHGILVAGLYGVDQANVLDPGMRCPVGAPDPEDPSDIQVQGASDRGEPSVTTDLDDPPVSALSSSATLAKSNWSVAIRASSSKLRRTATSLAVLSTRQGNRPDPSRCEHRSVFGPLCFGFTAAHVGYPPAWIGAEVILLAAALVILAGGVHCTPPE